MTGATARRWGDAGSGSVVVVGTCAALLSLLLVTLALAAAVVARHRAEAAADLAALAAADVAVGRATGATGDPCARALAVLRAQDARPVACAVAADGAVTVTALVRPAGVAGLLGTARATARAGQATSGEAAPAAEEVP